VTELMVTGPQGTVPTRVELAAFAARSVAWVGITIRQSVRQDGRVKAFLHGTTASSVSVNPTTKVRHLPNRNLKM